MSGEHKTGKSTHTAGAGMNVGKPESTKGVKSFTPGRAIEDQVGKPERTRPKAGGSMDRPTSIESNIVPPAKAPGHTPEPGITNTGK